MADPLGPKVNPFEALPSGLGSVPDPTRQQPNADIGAMMQDPKFQEVLGQVLAKRGRDKFDNMLEGKGSIQELAKLFPKLQEIQEKRKLEAAQKKVDDLKFDSLYKQAEQAFNALQGGQQGAG